MKQDVTLPMLWAIALPMLNSPESPSNSELARGKGKAPGLGLLKLGHPASRSNCRQCSPLIGREYTWLPSDWWRPGQKCVILPQQLP